MRWLDRKVLTVDIPKTGCKTKWFVGNMLNGQRLKSLERMQGHKPVSRLIEESKRFDINLGEYEFWTVIREPEKRLLSAFNYHFGVTDQLNMSLEEATVRAGNRPNAQEFFSHDYWLNVPGVKVRLWPMEDFPTMLRELGWVDEIPHKNDSYKIWAMQDLRSLSNYDELMTRYENDWKLYEIAKSSNPYYTKE